MKKAFTLVELTITIVIIALLIWVIFQTFTMIGHIAVKIQNERGLNGELIYIVQTIQNIVDEWDTTLFWYNLSGDSVLSSLNLSGTTETFVFSQDGTDLIVQIQDDIWQTNTYTLTDSSKIEINNFYVKIVPYDDQTVYANKMHDGFWLFIDAQVPWYDEDRWRYRVNRKMQTFFNIRKYD